MLFSHFSDLVAQWIGSHACKGHIVLAFTYFALLMVALIKKGV